MNKENKDNPLHKEDFDLFHVSCACSNAQLTAPMDGCCLHFQTFQEKKAAHYTREAKEVKAANVAKVKAETSLELFRLISQARDAKSVKAATSAAKNITPFCPFPQEAISQYAAVGLV
jgi:hypothetical protein